MNNKHCTKNKSGKLSRHYSTYKNNRKQYRVLRAHKAHTTRLGNGWPDSTQKFFNKSINRGRVQTNLKSCLWLFNTKPHLIKP
jgi:hypothetical protein